MVDVYSSGIYKSEKEFSFCSSYVGGYEMTKSDMLPLFNTNSTPMYSYSCHVCTGHYCECVYEDEE